MSIDIDYRPLSYWDSLDSLLANIKGTLRRELIEKVKAENRTEDIQPWVFANSVDHQTRDWLGKLHPSFMGGEYLPEYLSGQIEIVRVSLASTTGDVLSLRAQFDGKAIQYRWVDEYEDNPRRQNPYYVIEGESSSVQPLTLRELIELIKRTKCPDYYCPDHNLIQMFRDDEWGDDGTAEEAAEFARYSSMFYPQLSEWYVEDTKRWLKEETMEVIYEGPSVPVKNAKSTALSRLVQLAQYAQCYWDQEIDWFMLCGYTKKCRETSDPLYAATQSGKLDFADIASLDVLDGVLVEFDTSNGKKPRDGSFSVTVRAGLMRYEDLNSQFESIHERLDDYATENGLPLPW